MPGLGKKRPNVPPKAARYLDQLSKAALLELAYDLAAPRVECCDDVDMVLDFLYGEVAELCERRGDRYPRVASKDEGEE